MWGSFPAFLSSVLSEGMFHHEYPVKEQKSSHFILTLGEFKQCHFSELIPYKNPWVKNNCGYTAHHTVTSNLISNY